MPEIAIIRRHHDNNYQILLQRRSRNVSEPFAYTFPGGSYEKEEDVAVRWFLAAQEPTNAEREIRRAALREAIEEAGNGRSNGQRYSIVLSQIMAGNQSVPQLIYENVALPSGLANEFEQNASVSRRIGNHTYVYLLNSTLHDDGYINHWEPDALPRFQCEIDRNHTAHSLKNGYIWVNVDYFLSNPDHPVPGSSCPITTWLRRYCNGGEKTGKLMQAIRELDHFFAPFALAPATLPPPAPPAENNVFWGLSVDGYSGNRYPNLVKEWTAHAASTSDAAHRSSYPALRIYVGDGRAALHVCRTGLLRVDDSIGTTSPPRIHVVMNCAAAEEPYKYMNIRDGIVYANVVSMDNPTPAYHDLLQRPDWSAVIQAARTAYDMVETKKQVLPPNPGAAVAAGGVAVAVAVAYEPVNVLIHCRMGEMNTLILTLTHT